MSQAAHKQPSTPENSAGRRHAPAMQSTLDTAQRHLDSFETSMGTEPHARYWLQEADWQQKELDALKDGLLRALQDVTRLQRATTQAKVDCFKKFPQLRHSAAAKRAGSFTPDGNDAAPTIKASR